MSECDSILRHQPHQEDMLEMMNTQTAILTDYMKGELRGVCCHDLDAMLKSIVEHSTEQATCAKKAKFTLSSAYPHEISQLKERLQVN
jgi:hypothetical protein